MVELIILVVAIALGWSAIKIYAQTKLKRVELWAKEDEIELQDRYKEVYDKAVTTVARHGGKVYSMDDIDKVLQPHIDAILDPSSPS